MKNMNLIRGKKGFVFTVIAIALAVFFTLVFSAKVEKPLYYKTEILETRISVLSDYANTFFDYAQGIASISGYSALQGIVANISKARAYNPNFESQFIYCIRTGNLTTSSTCSNMTNKTLNYYLNQLRNLARDQLNINSTYVINSISVNQTKDAFSIEVTFNLSVNISDAFANISATRELTSSIPITGILDPLYLLNGTYNQTITPYFKPEQNWSYTDLQQLYNKRAYRKYPEGISFIDRIKGNLNSPNKDFGIQSFVNYTHPSVSFNESYTMVDYLFWLNLTDCSSTNPIIGVNDTTSFPLNSLSQHFQLNDKYHLEFSIQNYTIYPCS